MPFTARQVRDATDILDPLLRLHALYSRLPGMAFGVSHAGATVLLGAHGLADVESAVPVDASATTFRCASITKTVTATLIVQLAERGRLRLDDPVVSLLAWTRGTLGPDVTVRHLLMHSGGVIRDGSNAWFDVDMPDRVTLRRELRGSATFAEPSERFRYSNIAYSLLGEIAETVTGRSFESLVRANVA
ncbi:MAG: beta-lactamase family protein, partial [Acidobacteriota bacterium]|nr:beta-lactamase family protein [Acidobacteriota bacterium]